MTAETITATDGWPTKKEAAKAIGISTKTLETWAKAGKIQTSVRWAGSTRTVMCHPADVARLKQERKEIKPFVTRHPANAVPVALQDRQIAIFLPLRLASQVTGLPQETLRKMALSGAIFGLKTGAGWRIRWRDLEAAGPMRREAQIEVGENILSGSHCTGLQRQRGPHA